MGAVHDREVTRGGKASVLNEKFRAVNTLISNVKTALTGTYHAIKFAKYGYRYSPRSSSASTGAATCGPCSAACCGRLSQRRSSPSGESGLLRFIADQKALCVLLSMPITAIAFALAPPSRAAGRSHCHAPNGHHSA